jgi:hypothetical protein
MGLEMVLEAPAIIQKELKKKFDAEVGSSKGLTTIFGIDNERLTYGPTDNEVGIGVPINKGDGVWDITGCLQLSSDILLIYLSKYAQLYKQCRMGNRSRELPRSVKDKLIIDSYPVQHVRGR